jgi:diacylglycerol kinase family enzyme
MSGIGVVSNPRAGSHRRNRRIAKELTYVLGEKGEIHEPKDFDALEAAAERFHERDIDILCVNGGDGTLHRAITAMVRAYGERRLPRVALLRAGTMNTIANSLGVRRKASEFLEYVVDRYHAGAPMPQVSGWAMDIDDGAQYGFLFGTGAVSTFLEAYYEGSEPTPFKAAWLVVRAILSAIVRGRLVRRLFTPVRCEMVVDGSRWPRDEWITLAAGTVDGIGLGFRPFFEAPRHPGHIHALGFACSPWQVIREIPRFYRGQRTRSEDILDGVCTEFTIRAAEPIGYMVDGDFHRGGREVTVRAGPQVDFILPNT